LYAFTPAELAEFARRLSRPEAKGWDAPDVEAAAMQVYEAMRFGREDSTPAWVVAGNSLSQDVARRTVRNLLATPPASAPEVTFKAPRGCTADELLDDAIRSAALQQQEGKSHG
jgi:hypothetical protein